MVYGVDITGVGTGAAGSGGVCHSRYRVLPIRHGLV